jgi:transposase
VNPLLAKQYTAGNIRKVKNDPIDAQSLARMARVADNLPSPFSDTPQALWMRKKLGLLASLNKHVQGINSTLTSTEEAQGIVSGEDSAVVSEIKETLKTLRLTMTKLEKECVRETMKDPVLAGKMKLLATVPGLSPFVSSLCLHWFTDDSVTNPKSWVAYAGLDISVRESGTWRGKCRLTKRGNAYLRKRLFSSAWGAWMNDPQFKEYYDELKEEGRPHVEILLMIARKIVRISYMVLKNNEPYVATKCFSSVIPAATI